MQLEVSSGPRDKRRPNKSVQHKPYKAWFGDGTSYYTRSQLLRFYSSFTALGVLCLGLSYYFLSWLTPCWYEKEYGPCGDQQLYGVTIYVFLFPLGFMLLINGFSGLMILKALSARTKAIISGISGVSTLLS